MRGRRLSRDQWALLAIGGLVLLANALYLLHFFNPNPLGPKSQLTAPGTGGILAGEFTIDPNIGYTSQALGHLAAVDWLHLQVPWWNPYEGVGTPLAGEMQSAALFPPTLLLALADGQVYEHTLLELIAGLATYLLLRRLGLKRAACAAGAITFALGGTFAWLGNAPVNPVALLPALLLGLELAYCAAVAGRRGGWWLIAVALAASLYAGFPETAYSDSLLAVGWFAWRVACAGRQLARTFVLKALAGALAGGLVAAPVLVAFTGFLADGYTAAFTASADQLPTQGLSQLVLPYVYGSIFEFQDPAGSLASIWGGVGGYLTISLVLFGALGLASRGRRGLRLVLGVWVLLALSRIYGAPELGRVLGFLPGMSSVVFYRYGTPAVEMAATVLLALGLDDLGRVPGRRLRAIGCGALALAVVALAAVGAHALAGKLAGPGDRETYYRLAVGGGAAVAILGTGFALLRSPRIRVALACSVVVVETLTMFVVPELSAPQVGHTDFAAVTYLRQNLGLGRFATLGPLQPNYGSYFGVAALNSDDLPISKLWAHYIHAELDPAVNPLHFLGTSTSRPTLVAKLDGFRKAGVAYVLAPSYVRLAGSNPKSFRRVFSVPNATIYKVAGPDPYFTASGGACHIESESREKVSLLCTRPSTLTRREADLPGWTARVDGRVAPIQQADGLFQSVNLGAGPHVVSFSYFPPHMRWALAALLAGILWIVLGVVRLKRPRLRHRGRGTSSPAATSAGIAAEHGVE